MNINFLSNSHLLLQNNAHLPKDHLQFLHSGHINLLLGAPSDSSEAITQTDLTIVEVPSSSPNAAIDIIMLMPFAEQHHGVPSTLVLIHSNGKSNLLRE